MKSFKELTVSLLWISFIFVSPGVFSQLPDDFPTIHTTITGDTVPGRIFLANNSKLENVGFYLLIANQDGTIYKYKKSPLQPVNFKMHCDGSISYNGIYNLYGFAGGGRCHYIFLNEDLDPVDTIRLGNELFSDSHDLQVLPNGHILAFNYYPKAFDLSQIVPKGYPNAEVFGSTIQELDGNGKVIFQWKFWDHFDLMETNTGRINANPKMDPVHINTVEMDYDGNLILTGFQFNSVFKVSRQTGKVMWILGGKLNQFSFTNADSTEAVKWFDGHDFRIAGNGNYIFYDNNDKNTQEPSVAYEWQLDHENLTATKIWEHHSDSILGWAMGSIQRFSNGSTLIGWGDDMGNHGPACHEIDTAGNIVFDLTFDDPLVSSLKAYKYNYPATPSAERLEYEVYEGTFEFVQGDTLHTGITLEIEDFDGDGYNSFLVRTYNLAPYKPLFTDKAPRVLKNKILFSKQSIQSLSGKVFFDIDRFHITNPADITVYVRSLPNQKGYFFPVATTYNPLNRQIEADFSMNLYGNELELIFGFPDLAELAIKPHTFSPANFDTVNFEKPVRLEWQADGFVSDFQLQIALDQNFEHIVKEESYLESSVYYFGEALKAKNYYWRMRTNNKAGTSEWSDTAMFVTGNREIRLLQPYDNSVLSKGATTFVQWERNFSDSLVIKLFHADTLEMVLDTVYDDIAYKWIVPASLDSTCGYYMAVEDLHNSEVVGRNKTTFSIQDSLCINSEVPYIEFLTPVVYQSLKQGESLFISMNHNIDGEIVLKLFDEGIFQMDLATTNGSEYNWPVPLDFQTGSKYHLKAQSVSQPMYMANSEYFEIADSTQTSVEDLLHYGGELAVYPNPAKEFVEIELTDYSGHITISVFDLFGKEVLVENLISMKPAEKITVNTSSLKEGIYLLNVLTDSKKYSHKLVIR